MFKRAQFAELEARLSEPRNKIQVVSGPRQVGKSTMVKQVLQETDIPYMFVSADNIEHTHTAWIGVTWAPCSIFFVPSGMMPTPSFTSKSAIS